VATALSSDVVEISVGPLKLQGLLGVPDRASGVVIFAHGCGSGRLSPRNNYVAAALRAAGLATLLLDLLTPAEERDRRNVFDIELLASRLRSATDWVSAQPRLSHLAAGYFGAGTGAGAALMAAAAPGSRVAAVVSRGGRPDLALKILPNVRAPTLLLVGSLDGPVIGMNQRAFDALRSVKRFLIIIEGAGHLFEEPGTLDEVVLHATGWFRIHLNHPSTKGDTNVSRASAIH
jgi:putative phosphoribosyl transferase